MLVWALAGMPEVTAGADLSGMILDAIQTSGDALIDGDILIVTSKIVSKAEGRACGPRIVKMPSLPKLSASSPRVRVRTAG